MRRLLLVAATAALIAPAAQAGTNIVPTNWAVIGWPGNDGVLRAGSPWGPGSTPSNAAAPVDGTPQPEGTQWNNGSFWWDADPAVNPGPYTWTLTLNRKFSINQLIVQADDNDAYLVEYWNGSAWAPIFNVNAVPSFGLITRDSGLFAAIYTDRFRFSAVAGDNYFALGQFQALAVPEPASWAMLIAGFGLVGAASRRRQRVVAA